MPCDRTGLVSLPEGRAFPSDDRRSFDSGQPRHLDGEGVSVRLGGRFLRGVTGSGDANILVVVLCRDVAGVLEQTPNAVRPRPALGVFAQRSIQTARDSGQDAL